jgi:cell division transport system ATP-binding protein
VIIATHDTELIRTTGGRVVLLKAGRLETSTVIPALPR